MWRPHYSLHILYGGKKRMTALIAPDIFAIITSANQGWLSVWIRGTALKHSSISMHACV